MEGFGNNNEGEENSRKSDPPQVVQWSLVWSLILQALTSATNAVLMASLAARASEAAPDNSETATVAARLRTIAAVALECVYFTRDPLQVFEYSEYQEALNEAQPGALLAAKAAQDAMTCVTDMIGFFGSTSSPPQESNNDGPMSVSSVPSSEDESIVNGESPASGENVEWGMEIPDVDHEQAADYEEEQEVPEEEDNAHGNSEEGHLGLNASSDMPLSNGYSLDD